jgi:hypothetical protein
VARRRQVATDRSEVSKRVAKKIKPASERPHRSRVMIYGRSGAGKTRLASTAPDPLLVDVNEEGWDSVRGEPLNPHTFPVKYWSELSDVFWYLQEGPQLSVCDPRRAHCHAGPSSEVRAWR